MATGSTAAPMRQGWAVVACCPTKANERSVTKTKIDYWERRDVDYYRQPGPLRQL